MDFKNKSQIASDPIHAYINEMSLRLTKEQVKLIERTKQLPNSVMLSSIDQIQFFQIFLKAINARNVIEVGTYTGYTSMSMALVLPEGGKVITCDITDQFIAYDVWVEAGVDKKIQAIIAPANETLKNLLNQGMENTFDFAFIDANKQDYLEYYELCLKLIKKGGVVAIDNVLWGGLVADSSVQDENTTAIRKLNEQIKTDHRVDISLLNIGDGVTLCYKK